MGVANEELWFSARGGAHHEYHTHTKTSFPKLNILQSKAPFAEVRL
jgi:hypothetical protein